MARQQPRLTPAVQQTITAYIRAGGYPHVAAEAAGVPRDVFDDWLRRGEEGRPSRPHRRFARQVRQAVEALCTRFPIYPEPGHSRDGRP